MKIKFGGKFPPGAVPCPWCSGTGLTGPKKKIDANVRISPRKALFVTLAPKGSVRCKRCKGKGYTLPGK